MIRLNVSLIVEKSENMKPVIDKAIELVELSLHDKGCIDYYCCPIKLNKR